MSVRSEVMSDSTHIDIVEEDVHRVLAVPDHHVLRHRLPGGVCQR